jgi:exosortase A-associated hydrolase 2
LLYVHPFLEEAEVSRPVIAAVARAMAKLGYGVLMVDLYGCGDSEGEFRDARWETWREDLTLGVQWLRDRNVPRVGLWGLRLGGLLALDFACHSRAVSPFIVLWHPPSGGAETLTHFLRRSLVQEDVGPFTRTTKDLRRRLASGSCVEIAGWELNPDLAFALEHLELPSLLSRISSAVYCAEFVQATTFPSATTRLRILQACKASGAEVDCQQLTVRSFWADWSEATTDDCQVLSEFMKGVLAQWEI